MMSNCGGQRVTAAERAFLILRALVEKDKALKGIAVPGSASTQLVSLIETQGETVPIEEMVEEFQWVEAPGPSQAASVDAIEARVDAIKRRRAEEDGEECHETCFRGTPCNRLRLDLCI